MLSCRDEGSGERERVLDREGHDSVDCIVISRRMVAGCREGWLGERGRWPKVGGNSEAAADMV